MGQGIWDRGYGTGDIWEHVGHVEGHVGDMQGGLTRSRVPGRISPRPPRPHPSFPGVQFLVTKKPMTTGRLLPILIGVDSHVAEASTNFPLPMRFPGAGQKMIVF